MRQAVGEAMASTPMPCLFQRRPELWRHMGDSRARADKKDVDPAGQAERGGGVVIAAPRARVPGRDQAGPAQDMPATRKNPGP